MKKQTLKEIVKQLKEKADEHDQKAVLTLLVEDIPKCYAPLSNHPNLFALHKGREELETKVRKWWPKVDNTVVDDIHTFANFLQRFEQGTAKRDKYNTLDIRATAVLRDHPDWSVTRIAEELGVKHQALYAYKKPGERRLKTFHLLRDQLKKDEMRDKPKAKSYRDKRTDDRDREYQVYHD